MSRVSDVQGLAPRHREQRAAVAAPLPSRARRLPAGDRLRPRERVFLEGKSTSGGGTLVVTLTRLLGGPIEMCKEITSARRTLRTAVAGGSCGDSVAR